MSEPIVDVECCKLQGSYKCYHKHYAPLTAEQESETNQKMYGQLSEAHTCTRLHLDAVLDLASLYTLSVRKIEQLEREIFQLKEKA